MRIFISYAKDDAHGAEQIHTMLRDAGHQPWLDTQELLPGQDWKFEIQKAISACEAAIICLSATSVSKTGYVQVELAEFLDQQKRRPEGSIYLIPVRLDSCAVPVSLLRLQYVDGFSEEGLSRVMKAIDHAQRQQAVFREEGEKIGTFKALSRLIEESWDGLPGYSANLKYPEISGDTSSETCEELNCMFKAQCLSALYKLRSNRTNQDPARWKDRTAIAIDKQFMDYKITFLSNNAISVIFTIGGYGAGGAHGYRKFMSNNMFLQPISHLHVGSFFEPMSNYRDVLSTRARDYLRIQMDQRGGRHLLYEQLFMTGTTFRFDEDIVFTFSDAGITLYFDEYRIAPYAAGNWEVTIPYDELRGILRPDGVTRLKSV